MTEEQLAEAAAAVVRVGDGRGFIIVHEHNRLVVTAAHCLPRVPEPFPARYVWESTFEELIGPRDAEPTISAEGIFVEVIADLAVLGAPDNQSFYDQYAAYEEFIESRPALRLGDIPPSDLRARPLETHPVYVLKLDGQWARGRANHIGGPIWLDGPKTESGMSGSPILNDRGEAIGVISTGGPDPRLLRDLPIWLAPRQTE
jgi:hypothetical protein